MVLHARFVAEQQQPVRRRVALKIIKPGMDSEQVIARFEAERQALAMMDHPNIAKVLDAGATETGRPYFVMELVRGVPIIVLLLYVAFVLAPALVDLRNWLGSFIGLEEIRTRNFPLLWRAIVALMIAYSAFIAEVFRAGLQSVPEGQVEAAKALGLNCWQRFRFIVFPQAIRTILPPLGNDFVALVKDSSLVSVLGVLDITQLGKVTAASNFRYFETYNMVALIYLAMTISLSLGLRALERHLRNKQDQR